MSFVRLSSVCFALLLALFSTSAAWANGKHVYLLRGIFNVSTGLDTLAARLKKAGIAASVYGHGDSSEVAAAAIRDYKAGRVRAIVLVGHSLGGGAVISVADELNSVGIPVSLLITLDPVAADAIPPNVRRAINFYIGGLGGPVEADKGFHGRLQNVNVGDIPGMNHMRVQDMKLMQDRIMTLVRGG